jgi:two-component system, OmpR family, phosphate regulon response regulator PhoB
MEFKQRLCLNDTEKSPWIAMTLHHQNQSSEKVKPRTILVVEDNADLIETLSFTLMRAGFSVHKAKNANEAYQQLSKKIFDLILLDAMLPDESGFELCRSLREQKALADIPVIFLSARSAEIDKVTGFEVGADDYITKPFSVKELQLRIEAVLRRKKESSSLQIYSLGILFLDVGIPKITVADEEISLTNLELRLLHLFFLRQGRVQTRSELLNSVWKIDAEISTRTVDTHIKRLREKLLAAQNYIITVRGIGYRLATEEELAYLL